MRPCRRRRGFNLIDLMVAVFVCALLLAIFVPETHRGNIGGHRVQCQNNMRQLGLGLIQFSTAKNAFPQAGTFFDDPDFHQGDPKRSNIYEAIVNPATFARDPNPLRSNWVVEILPYLDNQELYNAWNREESYLSRATPDPSLPSNATIAATSISTLRCPEDPTCQPGQGNLNYAVNGGFARWGAIPVSWDGIRSDNGEPLQWTPKDQRWTATQSIVHKLGVMSPGTTTHDQPWDVSTTPSSIFDGSANTLMLGENTRVGYLAKGNRYSGGLPTNWACPLPNFCMFLASDDICQNGNSATNCLGGQLRPTPNGKNGPGWSRANRHNAGEGINEVNAKTAEGSFPFVNSGHPGGSNFVFCDGSVRYFDATMDGSVYARIVTPAGSKLPREMRQGPLSQDEVVP